ncbi:MAG: dienelactone hydrolase family protein [Deltaproteobacteria bacterium]|nr:dienelactone hydrolase family protein [Deltaproteobacteria bacterium]
MKQPLLTVITILCGIFVCRAQTAMAEVTERKVEYRDGNAKLVGYEIADTARTEKLPGVIIFSDWMGIGAFAKERGRELASLGYRAFVADIYGNAKQAANMEEAGALATKIKSDRKLFRSRARAAFDVFSQSALVDSSKIAAIGFCFGGTASLELARTGAPLRGLVSFHGGLNTDDLTLSKNIRGRVLVLHGADDPLVPRAEVEAFREEMRRGGVAWELHEYGGAVHSFTNPDAGNDLSKGFAYNKSVAERSYREMREFFGEVFGS